MTRERDVRRIVVHTLRVLGCRVLVLSDSRSAASRNTPGTPDLYAILPGRRGGLWVELKAPGGKLREPQQEFADACERAGIPHVYGGLPDVLDYLHRLGVTGAVAPGP